MTANYVMSHMLHFYHLAALDYVDASGLIPKGPTCPNYNNAYFNPTVSVENVLQALYGPLPPISGLAINGFDPTPFNALAPYLAGQYVRALKFRRLAQQLGGMFAGKMQH